MQYEHHQKKKSNANGLSHILLRKAGGGENGYRIHRSHYKGEKVKVRGEGEGVEIVDGGARKVLGAATGAGVASGTVTLEAAFEACRESGWFARLFGF